jgi:phosphoglycerate dehydrogenase-like enzyme
MSAAQQCCERTEIRWVGSGGSRSEQRVVVIGVGSIGQAIARRVSAGKHVLLADLRQDNAERRRPSKGR